MRITQFLTQNLKRRDHSEGAGVGGKTISEWILGKKSENMWTGFIWFRIRTMDERGSRVRFPAAAGIFSLHHRVQNGSGAHLASYPMGTRGSFPGSKAVRVWSWPLTSIWSRGQRRHGAIPPLPQ
jgi:hypothetical protein